MRESPIPNPRFTGLFIPAEVLSIPDLSPNEIMLLAWIDALYNEDFEGCFASNSYFAEKLRVKEDTITRMISKLKEKKLIEQVGFDGRTRIIRAVKENWFNQKSDQVEKPEADSDLNPSQTRKKILGSTGLKSGASIYSKEDSKDYTYTPSISPSSAGAESSANADGVCVDSKNSSKKKKAKEQAPKVQEFSPEVQEVAAQMVEVMQRHSKTFRAPAKPVFQEAAKLLLKQNQDIAYVLKILDWACKDTLIVGEWNGWASMVYSVPSSSNQKYGITKFCVKLDSIEKKMKARKDCKLTPGADLSSCDESIAEWKARSL